MLLQRCCNEYVCVRLSVSPPAYLRNHMRYLYQIFVHVTYGRSPARVVRRLDHLDAMCSRAWRALCAVGSRFNSSRGPGKARPPT